MPPSTGVAPSPHAPSQSPSLSRHPGTLVQMGSGRRIRAHLPSRGRHGTNTGPEITTEINAEMPRERRDLSVRTSVTGGTETDDRSPIGSTRVVCPGRRLTASAARDYAVVVGDMYDGFHHAVASARPVPRPMWLCQVDTFGGPPSAGKAGLSASRLPLKRPFSSSGCKTESSFQVRAPGGACGPCGWRQRRLPVT